MTRRDERGAVAVIAAALMSAVLFTLCALVVDLGLARERKQASQTNSDAAALAAATALYLTGGDCSVSPCFAQAIEAAKEYTEKNFPEITESDWDSCEDPTHYYVVPPEIVSDTTECISFAGDGDEPSSDQPTKVRVVTPRTTVKAAFGGAVGVSSVPIQTAARAKLKPGMNRSCGLCLISPNTSDVGNSEVTVSGASIHTNGSFEVGATGSVRVVDTPNGAITTFGHCSGPGSMPCDPAATTAPVIDDPYSGTVPSAATVVASYALAPKSGSPCGTAGSAGPGVYSASITLSSDCALRPGVYVITGGWTEGNNTTLRGTDVALYFTCASGSTVRNCNSPGEAGGFLNMKNGTAELSGRLSGVDDLLEGFSIIYDANNTQKLTLQGNGGTDDVDEPMYVGTVYAPKSELYFNGNSCITIQNGPVIVGKLTSTGTKACLTLTSAVGADIPMPPGPPNLDR
jgi:hypothetical protein